MLRRFVWTVALTISCGASDSESQTAGVGGRNEVGGSGGDTMTGDAGAGGGNTSGSGGGAGTGLGGSDSDAASSGDGKGFCSPGKTFEDTLVYSMFGGPMMVCYNYKTSPTAIQDDPFLSIRDVTLESPMMAGQAYAFSIDFSVVTPTGTLEFWGAGSQWHRRPLPPSDGLARRPFCRA